MESIQAPSSSLLPCGRVVMQMQTQMQMLPPFARSGISASDELGLLPPPLAGEGWGGGERAHVNLFACPLGLVACPLPSPPAEVGYIGLRPTKAGRTRVNPSSVQAGEGMRRARGDAVASNSTQFLQGDTSSPTSPRPTAAE